MARRSAKRVAARSSPGTRDRLLDCALTLFAAKGYSATGTQEIIDAAGVTKPALYYYFESKDALFRQLVGNIYDATIAAWDAIIAQEKSAVSRLRRIAHVSFEGSARDPRLPCLLMQTHYGPPIAELRAFMEAQTSRRFHCITKVITAALENSELKGGDDVSLALLFCCIMDQHINVLARMPNASTLLTTARADALVDAFLHGCGTASRRAFSLPSM